MSAAYIQVHFRLDFSMESNNMDPEWSSLIWVHIVCNIVGTRGADFKSREMWAKSYDLDVLICDPLI